jgi:glycine cleavage system H protein
MTVYYTKDHEWISVDGDSATVGITDFAQKALGDVVFVEVPAAGKALSQGDEAAVVESVKAASEVYAPVSGTVTAGNAAIEETPDLVNSDPEGAGWFFKLTLSDNEELSGLMNADQYQAYCAELE